MASSDDATLAPVRAAQDVSREHYDFLAPPQAPDELGRLGPYRILKVLGAGGMGVVFLGEDPQLERKVALKAMLPTLAASDSARQRFLREARTAASIEHDHIVPIFQVGEDRGVPFIAMPFLQGEPLDERLKREQRLPLAEVLRIGRETADGLAAAHERGLIHRDIKPANLWLEGARGRVKILDFGLARAAVDNAQLTQQGAIIGTPAYMAPEQASGGAVDARCDLFSLGCVLYRICTGKAAFKGTDTISTLMAVAMDQPAQPCLVNPAVPAALSDLVMQLLAKKPEDRPATAHVVVQSLQDIEGQSVDKTARLDLAIGKGKAGGTTRRNAAGTQAGRSAKRWSPLPWLVGGGVLGLGLLAAALVLFWLKPRGLDKSKSDEPQIERAVDKPAPPVKEDKELRTRRAAEWVLSIGGTGTILVAGKEQKIAAAKALPAGVFLLTRIDLWDNQQATDDGIGHLEGLTSLTDLNLGQTPVSDAGLAHLKGLTSLTGLMLRGTRVTDTGLEHLKELTNLRGLSLDYTQVRGTGFVHLKGLPKLTKLGLWYSQATGMGLEHLNNLTYLLLSNTQVSDAGLAHLKGLTSLTHLELYETPVSDAGLAHLEGLTNLTGLDLHGTRVSDAGLAHLKGLTSLSWLNLGHTSVSDAGLQTLATLPDLRTLVLDQTQITGRGLGQLARLPRLAELSLAGSKVSDSFAAEVGPLKKLERLSLAGCTFSDAGLKPLAGLSNLTSLDLTGTQVTAEGIAGLQKALPKCQIEFRPAAK